MHSLTWSEILVRNNSKEKSTDISSASSDLIWLGLSSVGLKHLPICHQEPPEISFSLASLHAFFRMFVILEEMVRLDKNSTTQPYQPQASSNPYYLFPPKLQEALLQKLNHNRKLCAQMKKSYSHEDVYRCLQKSGGSTHFATAHLLSCLADHNSWKSASGLNIVVITCVNIDMGAGYYWFLHNSYIYIIKFHGKFP